MSQCPQVGISIPTHLEFEHNLSYLRLILFSLLIASFFF